MRKRIVLLRMHCVCALLLAVGLLALTAHAAAPLFPEIRSERAVQDFCNMFSPQEQSVLEKRLQALFRSGEVELKVAVLQDIGTLSPMAYATALGNTWHIGEHGALLLIVPPAGKTKGQAALALGGALAHRVSDAAAKQLIDQSLLPYFKKHDYISGVLSLSENFARLTQQPTGSVRAPGVTAGGLVGARVPEKNKYRKDTLQTDEQGEFGMPIGIGLILAIALGIFIMRSRRGGSRNSSGWLRQALGMADVLQGWSRQAGGGPRLNIPTGTRRSGRRTSILEPFSNGSGGGAFNGRGASGSFGEGGFSGKGSDGAFGGFSGRGSGGAFGGFKGGGSQGSFGGFRGGSTGSFDDGGSRGGFGGGGASGSW